jgi:hypothetical protein
MSWARWGAGIAAVVLFIVVPIAMWLGLREEPRPPPRERATPAEEETSHEELEHEGETEPEPEPPEEEPREGTRVVYGYVTDQDDEPIEGVEVRVAEGPRATTDAEGGYRLRAVTLEPVTLLATAPGYHDAQLRIAGGEPDDQSRHDLALEPGGAVVGHVVDHEGKPVPGAKVRCVDRPRLETLADRDGVFELPEEAAGCDAIATHSPQGDSPRVTLALGPANLIAMSRPSSLAGFVVDASGHPVERFTLSIDSFQPAEKTQAPARRFRQTFTHPQGRFSILRVDPGTYVLEVRATGHAPARSPSILVRHGEDVRDVQIRLS